MPSDREYPGELIPDEEDGLNALIKRHLPTFRAQHPSIRWCLIPKVDLNGVLYIIVATEENVEGLPSHLEGVHRVGRERFTPY